MQTSFCKVTEKVWECWVSVNPRPNEHKIGWLLRCCTWWCSVCINSSNNLKLQNEKTLDCIVPYCTAIKNKNCPTVCLSSAKVSSAVGLGSRGCECRSLKKDALPWVGKKKEEKEMNIVNTTHAIMEWAAIMQQRTAEVYRVSIFVSMLFLQCVVSDSSVCCVCFVCVLSLFFLQHTDSWLDNIKHAHIYTHTNRHTYTDTNTSTYACIPTLAHTHAHTNIPCEKNQSAPLLDSHTHSYTPISPTPKPLCCSQLLICQMINYLISNCYNYFIYNCYMHAYLQNRFRVFAPIPARCVQKVLCWCISEQEKTNVAQPKMNTVATKTPPRMTLCNTVTSAAPNNFEDITTSRQRLQLTALRPSTVSWQQLHQTNFKWHVPHPGNSHPWLSWQRVPHLGKSYP